MTDAKAEEEAPGTLQLGEFHPMARNAMVFLQAIGTQKLLMYQESFCSCSIEGNRVAEICAETLRRVLENDPVSDRYLLGLAWQIRDMEDFNENYDPVKNEARTIVNKEELRKA